MLSMTRKNLHPAFLLFSLLQFACTVDAQYYPVRRRRSLASRIIAAIVVSCLVGLGLLLLLCVLIRRRRVMRRGGLIAVSHNGPGENGMHQNGAAPMMGGKFGGFQPGGTAPAQHHAPPAGPPPHHDTETPQSPAPAYSNDKGGAYAPPSGPPPATTGEKFAPPAGPPPAHTTGQDPSQNNFVGGFRN